VKRSVVSDRWSVSTLAFELNVPYFDFFVRIWVMAVAHRGLKVKVSQGQGSWLRLARIVTRSV